MSPALRLRRDIVCQQAVELVTGYLEGSLARAGRRRFEAHLAGTTSASSGMSLTAMAMNTRRWPPTPLPGGPALKPPGQRDGRRLVVG